ncbi:sensor histidine kinase [Chromobacterium haemolyticum]|uniref:sensor histidine kinase n=1 Tax=Chromobacterium haemolyticum TaxID=394935 RepID=UPI000D30C131|nr:sensor histidine kinase [Chromobacterium haemolyticum]PTU71235.1 sensor histidine kinase [Chromobacterium haemolyticum]
MRTALSRFKPASLRKQLLLGLSAPLLLMLALDGWMTYNRALQAANTAFDRMLLSSGRAIADGVAAHDGAVSVDIPYFALQMFESNASGKVFYRVSRADGALLTGYDDLPLPPPRRREGIRYQPDYMDIPYHGETLRLLTLRLSVRDMSTLRSQDVWIQVAETPESREQLARTLLIGSLAQETLLGILMLAIVLLAVGHSLRPLRRLSRNVVARKETDLSPLPSRELPTELTPLVEALNQQGVRWHKLQAARRRFIDDAAHQLKTPLAVMRTQAELARRQALEPSLRQQLDKLLTSLDSASHGVHQLLQLARVEPDNGQAIELHDMDLAAWVREWALEQAPWAHGQGADLGYEGEDTVRIRGNAGLLRELLANLLDNAIRYHPRDRDAQITIAAGALPTPWLRVDDNGHGIAETEQDKVWLRFYRIAGAASSGSGLGLAIVREIAHRHGAAVELSRNAGGGLCVKLQFPPADNEAV